MKTFLSDWTMLNILSFLAQSNFYIHSIASLYLFIIKLIKVERATSHL